MNKNYINAFMLRGMLLLSWLIPTFLWAQEEVKLKPASQTYAITNVNIIQAPGRKIDMGTVLIQNGLITAVGKNVRIPADAQIIKADSMYVYAGFIDGLSNIGVPKPREEQRREREKDPGNPSNERAGITPENELRAALNPADKSIEEWRSVGFTVTQAVPYGNMLPGKSAIIQLHGDNADRMILRNNTGVFSQLSGASGVYPNTVIAVMSKFRELYTNASLTKSYESMYAQNSSGLSRPNSDRVLESFYPVIDKRIPMVFKAERLLDVHRVMTLKNDLGFPLVIADVKEGWDVISKLKSPDVKVFLSLDLPEEMKKEEKKEEKKEKTRADLEKEALDKRKQEAIDKAVSQAATFRNAGIQFGFSTMTAKSKDVHSNIRRMVAAGLPEDAALAALTTTPAQLMGIADRVGTVDNGKIANIVLTDKPYFDEKAKIRYVFVDGHPYKFEVKEAPRRTGNNNNGTAADIQGSWSITIESPQGRSTGSVSFKKDGNTYSGTTTSDRMPGATALKTVELDGTNLTYTYTLSMGDNSIDVEVSVKLSGNNFDGTMSIGQWGSFPIEGVKDPNN
ncbi:MAG TPA: amidohydrolase family protein [Cyclobacteriaceae bacterium]|nr:amidohydrolase family protein [Cyclobacteriaceae bacterium]